MNFPPCSALRAYSVIPCESTRTVAPLELVAVLTTSEAELEVVGEDELELELEPHAASRTEAASVGSRILSDVSILSPPLLKTLF
jgi:hypothetical protein